MRRLKNKMRLGRIPSPGTRYLGGHNRTHVEDVVVECSAIKQENVTDCEPGKLNESAVDL